MQPSPRGSPRSPWVPWSAFWHHGWLVPWAWQTWGDEGFVWGGFRQANIPPSTQSLPQFQAEGLKMEHCNVKHKIRAS